MSVAMIDQKLRIGFADKTLWDFEAAWVIDAVASRKGKDDFRRSSAGFKYLLDENTRIVSVEIASNQEGSADHLKIEWHVQKDVLEQAGQSTFDIEENDDSVTDQSVARVVENVPFAWLRCLAPLVAEPKNTYATSRTCIERDEITSLCEGPRGFAGALESELEEVAHDGKGLSDITESSNVFSYNEMKTSKWKHLEFLKAIAKTGFAWIDGIPKPSEEVFRKAEAHRDHPVQEAAKELMGNFPSHASRYGNHFVFDNQCSDEGKASQDYNLLVPLALHTDHTIYQGTPGFLAWFHQVLGDTEPVLVDGLAVTKAFATEHPEMFRLLVSAKVMHGYTHALYGKDGMKRKVDNPEHEPIVFDLMYEDATTVNLYDDTDVEDFISWAKGEVEGEQKGSGKKTMLYKLRLSDSKRTILPGGCTTDNLKEFMQAYDTFRAFAADKRFEINATWPEGRTLVFSNYRMLHGRSRFLGPERITIGGYTSRLQWNSKLRQLHRECSEELAPELRATGNWITSIPDVALHNISRITIKKEMSIKTAAQELNTQGWTVVDDLVNTYGSTMPLTAVIANANDNNPASMSVNQDNKAMVKSFPYIAQEVWQTAGWKDVKLGDYTNGNTKREKIAADSVSIYDVQAGCPPHETIMPHSELAYTYNPPKFAAFFCENAAETGGEMTVTDMRAVASDLKNDDRYAELYRKLETCGFQYKRYMGCRVRTPDWPYATGFWQDLDTTSSSFEEVAQNLKTNQAFGNNPSLTLIEDSGTAALEWQIPAFGSLGKDQVLLANHMDFLRCVASEACSETKEVWGVTREVQWGHGGGKITVEEVEAFKNIYEKHTQDVLLTKSQLLIADNFWVAHGRRPYVGNKRDHYAIFSETYPRGVEEVDVSSDDVVQILA